MRKTKYEHLDPASRFYTKLSDEIERERKKRYVIDLAKSMILSCISYS